MSSCAALLELVAPHNQVRSLGPLTPTLSPTLSPTTTPTPTPTPTLAPTRCASTDGAVAAGGSLVYRKPEAAPARPRGGMHAPPERSMRRRSLNQSKRIGSVSNLLAFGPSMADADGGGGGRYGYGGGARPLSRSMALAFQEWTGHGQACLRADAHRTHYTSALHPPHLLDSPHLPHPPLSLHSLDSLHAPCPCP